MKRTKVAQWLLAIGLLCASKAQAANPDTMAVSVSPNVTYAVTVSSVHTNGYDFGAVALGASTQSTAAIVVTNTGLVAEYFSLAITNTSGNWSAVTGVPSQDEFRLMAQLSPTQPAAGSFTDALSNPPVPGVAASLYGQANTQTIPTASQNLWLHLEMPTTLNTGGTGAQTMTLIVNGQAS